jgi:CRISPR/Cas system CMR-associated protein Cmr5 small subunit
LKQIPDIVENYDDVLFVPHPNGNKGIYYVKQHNGTTYFLEAIAQNDALIGKQMIKVPTGTVPDIRGLSEAINKKWSAYSRQMNKIPRMYVQDVSHTAPFFENNSENTDELLNVLDVRPQSPRSLRPETLVHSDSTAVNDSIRENDVGNVGENVNNLQNKAASAAVKEEKANAEAESVPKAVGKTDAQAKQEAETETESKNGSQDGRKTGRKD